MTILLINNFFYDRGGAPRAMFDLEAMLIARGHKVVHFSMQHPHNRPSTYAKYFVRFRDLRLPFSLKRWRDYRDVVYNPEAKKNLERLLRDEKIDVAHVHNYYHYLSPSIFVALRNAGVPVVATAHDFKLISPNYLLADDSGVVCEGALRHKYTHAALHGCVHHSHLYGVLLGLERLVFDLLGISKQLNQVIVPSAFHAKNFMEAGFPKNKLVVLPNITSLTAQPLPAQKDTTTFAYIGRLSPEKGITVFLDALAQVPEARGVIAGDGPLRDAIMQRIAADRTSTRPLYTRVEMVGFIDREQQRDAFTAIFAQARAVAVPSTMYENAPLIMHEAHAFGRPVIASAIGGIPEIASSAAGDILVPAADASALAQAMRKSLATDYNPEAVVTATAKSRDTASYIQTVEALYSKVGPSVSPRRQA